MGKIEYDFREGLEKDKIIYINDKRDWGGLFFYFCYILFAWSWAIANFSLWYYAYIYHEPTAFWIFVGIWLGFIVFLITVSLVNIHRYNRKKEMKLKQKLNDEKQKDESHKQKMEERKMETRGDNENIAGTDQNLNPQEIELQNLNK